MKQISLSDTDIARITQALYAAMTANYMQYEPVHRLFANKCEQGAGEDYAKCKHCGHAKYAHAAMPKAHLMTGGECVACGCIKFEQSVPMASTCPQCKQHDKVELRSESYVCTKCNTSFIPTPDIHKETEAVPA